VSFTPQSAITRALQDLSDPSGLTWDATAFMLPRVGDAVAEIVRLVPGAYVVKKQITLVAGESMQSAPAGTVRILKMIRNMGTSGSAPGRAVRLASEDDMSAIDPDWHASSTDAEISHWVYDKDTPQIFYVWRRPREAIKIDALVSEVPAAVGILANVPVTDTYFNPIVAYLKSRAYDKSGRRYDPAKATAHYTAFLQMLGVEKNTNAEQAPATKRRA